MGHLTRSLKIAEVSALALSSKVMPQSNLKKAIRRTWAQKLVGLRGVPLKFSQILSTTQNEEQVQLQQEALQALEPLPLATIEAYLRKQAPDLHQKIVEISEQGIPASLGQVHRIDFEGGASYALKVKYPDIERNMDLDAALLGLMTKTFNHFKEGFALQDYQAVIRSELQGELDYVRERNFQEKMYHGFRSSESIVIPKPEAQYSGADHIVMSWEEGMFLPEFLDVASEKEKQKAATAWMEFFMINLFELGLIHADPNLGNFAFRRSAKGIQLVVYDFGSVIPFPKEKAGILFKLLEIVERGEGDVLPWLVELGFLPEPLSAIHSQLLAFFELLMEPFASQFRYDLKNWNRKQRAEQILGAERWNFMVAAPADLLPFMRGIQGLFYYSKRLDQGMYAFPFLERYRVHALNELPTLPTHLPEQKMAMAQHLKIVVLEHGVTKVALTFPRGAVENLADMIDDEVQKKMIEQEISLDDIVKRCRNNGYRPMALFAYESASKTIKVDLE